MGGRKYFVFDVIARVLFAGVGLIRASRANKTSAESEKVKAKQPSSSLLTIDKKESRSVRAKGRFSFLMIDFKLNIR